MVFHDYSYPRRPCLNFVHPSAAPSIWFSISYLYLKSSGSHNWPKNFEPQLIYAGGRPSPQMLQRRNILNGFILLGPISPDWKNSHWLSEKLATLGIIEAQLRAPLKTTVLRRTMVFGGAHNCAPVMSRDVCLSDSYMGPCCSARPAVSLITKKKRFYDTNLKNFQSYTKQFGYLA